MIEIIKETLNELKSIKIDIQGDKEKIDNSIKNLEFIVKEYKRLIDDFIKNSKPFLWLFWCNNRFNTNLNSIF